MDRNTLRIVVPLGMLAAIVPAAIDMYLPALPELAHDLAASEGEIQLSVMAFFAGLTIGQLFYGPLSDRIGRKPAILSGLALFVIGSIGCALAQSAGQLLIWRLVEGLGGSVSFTLGLAIIRDLFTGQRATRLLALVILVLGVSPILAPSGGAVILQLASWRAIFVVIAVYGTLAAAVTAWAIPETHPKERRVPFQFMGVMVNYGRLFLDRRYILFVLVVALIQASFFAYLAASAFVFIDVFGLSPGVFSIVFAVNAAGLIGASQVAPALIGRFSPVRIIRVSVALHLLCGLILLGTMLTTAPNVYTLALPLFIAIALMGIVSPAGSVMAMQSQGEIAGTAAALMGAVQFGLGVVSSAIVGAMADGTAMPLVIVLAGCGVAAAFCAAWLPPHGGEIEKGAARI